jgi:hypothetical protein
MTMFLSFADENGFRGACVVDVTDAAIAAAVPELLPQSRPAAAAIIAALREAHAQGCNPGGAVLAAPIPPWTFARINYPKNRLLTRAMVERIEQAVSN